MKNRAYLLASLQITAVLIFVGCAAIQRPVKGPPLSIDKASEVISGIQDQCNRVLSFYSSGTISVRDWKWESEADTLIAGVRDPLKIKIEITHAWGAPVFHILIDRDRLEVLSFEEKKLYLGGFTPEGLSRFFPGGLFDRDLIWAILRGYPIIMGHEGIESPGANRVSLSNQRGDKIEIIDLYPVSLQPKRISFPRKNLDLAFSGFRENDGIQYAGEVKVSSIKGGRYLVLTNEKMVFNRSIPDQIFTIQRVPGFETVHLDGLPDDSNK
jgi:hypothetical protein